MGFKHRAAD